MEEEDKLKEIKSLYGELNGYYANVPKNAVYDEEIWNNCNALVDSLNEITGNNYDKFKIEPKNNSGSIFIRSEKFKMTLGGLISKLHSEYFDNNSSPLEKNSSSMVISQSQNQISQIQILLDFQSLVDNKISNYKEGSKEESFLKKIKESLSNVKNIAELLTLVMKTGKDIGLTAKELFEIFL